MAATLMALLLAIVPVTSNGAAPAEGPVSDATALESLELRIEALALERDRAVIEARSELQEQAHARLEILLAAFAALLTVVIVFFAFRTERMAVAAATKGIADERREISMLLDAARQAVSQIQSHVSLAEAESARVRAALNAVMTAGPIREEDRKALENEARSTLQKSLENLTEQEFKVRIGDALAKEDYEKALLLAGKMREVHDSAEAKAWSRYAEVRAHHQQEDYEQVIHQSNELLDDYRKSLDPDVVRIMHRARVVLSTALANVGRSEEALTHLEIVVTADPAPDPETVEAAWFNRACYFAIEEDIAQVIENLRKMRIGPTLLRHLIDGDDDFDRVRDHPQLVQFLKGSARKPRRRKRGKEGDD